MDCVYEQLQQPDSDIGVNTISKTNPTPNSNDELNELERLHLYAREGTVSTSSQVSPSSASVTDSVHGLGDITLARELCDVFFEEIAPLRCFGFLHRHTYIQGIGKQPPEQDCLLLCVCALATKTTQKHHLWELGNVWARMAQRLVLTEIGDISVHRLTCIVLLHEHALRIEDHRLCFMLSAMAARYAQALSLNLEHDNDVLCTAGDSISPLEKESRRRLFWACYIIDTLQACGVQSLQLTDSSTIRIQLPCDERHFRYKMACRTSPCAGGAGESQSSTISGQNQDLDSFCIRLHLIRERALQYINGRWNEDDPWRLTSPLADLDNWKESLPPELQFNSDVIAIRKEESTLSALISLHVLYHQANCILYRSTIPSMLFPARAQTGLSLKASPDFLSASRKGWFDHACAMSTIFEVALQYRPVSMADPTVAGSVYNAIIIKWLYLTNFVPVEDRLQTMDVILPMANTDLAFLEGLRACHPCVHTIFSAAKQLVEEAPARIVNNPGITLSETSNLVENLGVPGADGFSPEQRTNQLASFAQMRKKLPDAHRPTSSSGQQRKAPSAGKGLWVWR